MADTPAARESERWRAIKILRASEMPWSEVVNSLTESGLLECRNHSATRTTPDGVTFCTTCEDTVTQFWRRNVAKLREDEIDVFEVRWRWQNAHEYIAAMCKKHVIRNVEIVTERTTMETARDANGNNIEQPVTVRTVKRETRIDRGLLQLLSHVHDKMARVGGMDVDDAESLTPVPRGKTRVNRHTGADERDGGTVH